MSALIILHVRFSFFRLNVPAKGNNIVMQAQVLVLGSRAYSEALGS